VPIPDVEHEIAMFVHLESIRSFGLERDRARVGSGANDEIVFELALVPVDKVHAWINVFVGHPRQRHIS
jgi:hypothetical protein